MIALLWNDDNSLYIGVKQLPFNTPCDLIYMIMLHYLFIYSFMLSQK